MGLVLCVEDDPDIRELLIHEFQYAHHSTAEAGNGVEALEAIRAKKPDLIVCDKSMPGMSGDQLLAELRNNQPQFKDIPFVMLTGFSDAQSAAETAELGADEYLIKPISFDRLSEIIEMYLGA